MELLFLDGLPPRMGKGEVLSLLIEQGQVNKLRVGKIALKGSLATVEVADGWAGRASRALDGVQVDTRHIRAWHQLLTESEGDHFGRLLRWLNLESQAELEALQHSAESDTLTSIAQLVIKSQDIGLGERVLLQLTPRNEQAKLPYTRLSVGSPIIVAEENCAEPINLRGVVSQIRSTMIEVALSYAPEPVNNRPIFTVSLASDEISRQRMQRAIARVSHAEGSRLAELRDILLGKHAPSFTPSLGGIDPFAVDLNPSQRAAIDHALSAEDVAIIHGPPGTGKTTTVVALIRLFLQRDKNVLACAPSNLAVDGLCEKLVAAGEKVVRLGHPSRVSATLQAHTLDALVEEHEDYLTAKKLRKQADNLHREASKFRRAQPEKGAKQAMRDEAGELREEARQLEAQAVRRIIDQASVVLGTLTALDSAVLGQRQFDVAVIDEAGQAVEPATWIPILRAKKVIFAGDHLQLPPTIVSKQAAKEGFGLSLLERLISHDPESARQLTIQYRMNSEIMGFSSAEFYNGSLIAHSSVADCVLADFPDVPENELTTTPLTYIDTAGASYDEENEAKGKSYLNPLEGDLVVQKAIQLLEYGILPAQIGVITPYSGQVRYLRERLPTGVEVNSVDGFQGREKDVIIISLVRSNPNGEIGFLAETRRMNVALTRARRKLIVIGDSGTITTHPFYVRWIDYCEEHNAYHSIWEELACV